MVNNIIKKYDTVTNNSTNAELAKYIGAMSVANEVRDVILEEMKRKEFKDVEFLEALFNALSALDK